MRGMNIGQRLLQNTDKRMFTPCLFSSKRFLPVQGLPALLTALLILVSCDGDVPLSSSPAISFRTPAVFKSKMLYETQRTVQNYTNELLVNGKPVDDGYMADVTYTITEPADYAAKKITLNEKTGELSFENIPAAVTVQAAHPQVGTAAYTFTVTDHFSKRNNYSSVVLGPDIYVIGGSGEPGRGSNDVWKSSDGGAAWTQAAASKRFSKRRSHSSVVLGSDIYVIGGINRFTRPFGNPVDDQVWKSTDGGVTWPQIAAAGAKFSARRAHSSVTAGSAIYVIGGQEAARFNEVWKSTNGGVTWTQAAKTSARFPPRYSHGSVVLNGTIYVIAGHTSDFTNDVWKSEDGGKTWKNVHAAP